MAGRIERKEKDKPRLLYFYPAKSSFVQQDTTSFEEVYSVRTFAFLPAHKYKLPLSLIRQKLFLLFNIRKTRILVCQFAGYHSLLPVIFAKLFHKPCLVVVGGTDCVSFPAINYGNLRKPLLAWFTLRSLRWATQITAPSESLIESDYTYLDGGHRKQGYRYFDNMIKTSCVIIPNGIDIDRFKPVPGINRKNKSFLTIVNYIDGRNYLLKGLDMFVEQAKQFPECDFTVIGRLAPGYRFASPGNVRMMDYIPNEMLPSVMSAYTFYCQFSVSEGFGVSMAEAMACGCVPLVSDVGPLKNIVADSGFVLEKKDPLLLKSLIQSALEADNKVLAVKARKQILDHYTSEIRKKALMQLIRELQK